MLYRSLIQGSFKNTPIPYALPLLHPM